MTLQWLMILAA